MRKNKKSTLSVNLLIGIIVALLVFFTIMFFDQRLFHLMRSSGEDSTCAFSAFKQSFFKSFGKTTSVLKCKTYQVHLTYDELKLPIPNGRLKKLKEWWPEFYDLYTDSLKRGKITKEELNVDYNSKQRVAAEMKSCWNRLGRGDLDLFEEDWLPIGYEKGTFTGDEGYFMYALKLLEVWKITVKDSPTMCVFCSTIEFDDKTIETLEKVNKAFSDDQIGFDKWLRNHPVSVLLPKPKSYFEFMLDNNKDMKKLESKIFTPYYHFDVSKEAPLVVTFIRQNIFYSSEVAGVVSDIFTNPSEVGIDKGFDYITIMPYTAESLRNSCSQQGN